ncbi:MAG: ATP-binding cassette domain-containing protein [Christensenellaceae bacterium]|jgi:ATPase subunit of ABC transporter with duplicated ATPase domains|nr:ATP-binding cassette domain-containing protein [Christensenellaceae bacterium]
MLQTVNISLQYGKRVLFKEVNLKFNAGECYGIIGANGAGKSTFLKILSGEITANKGEVIVGKNERISTLAQDQNAFNEMSAVNAVISGHKRIAEINKMLETETDGDKLAVLYEEYGELDGWNADTDARKILSGLGIDDGFHDKIMGELDAKIKVKVLLARTLFGNPDILILDEPTNNLDLHGTHWLEDFLLDFKNTVIIVSHNRHFLNKVCTRICDVDFGQINMFIGNYDFWYETSQLLLRQQKDANKKAEARADELKEFIARFSANASKSRQATSRKKELEKLTIEDIKPSSRKYPYINFEIEREVGNEILAVNYKHINFRLNKGDKVAIMCQNSKLVDELFNAIANNESGVEIGKTIKLSYLPQNYDNYFNGVKLNLLDWLKQYSKDTNETFIRGWLGRMLFSGEEALKTAEVLSGGEKVRCMLAKTMLNQGNLLIMNEPTNHLDLESITALNEGMKRYKGVMLFYTSDEQIIETVANRTFYITEDTFVMS